MSRVIQAVMTAAQRADVAKRPEGLTGVVGVAVLVGASRTPTGDIVGVQASNDAARVVAGGLTLGSRDGSSIAAPSRLERNCS